MRGTDRRCVRCRCRRGHDAGGPGFAVPCHPAARTVVGGCLVVCLANGHGCRGGPGAVCTSGQERLLVSAVQGSPLPALVRRSRHRPSAAGPGRRVWAVNRPDRSPSGRCALVAFGGRDRGLGQMAFIGGFTGDVLGAAVESSGRTVGLVVRRRHAGEGQRHGEGQHR